MILALAGIAFAAWCLGLVAFAYACRRFVDLIELQETRRMREAQAANERQTLAAEYEPRMRKLEEYQQAINASIMASRGRMRFGQGASP